MSITIQDIWESLLESDSGHIQIGPLAMLDLPIIKRLLTKYKYHEMENVKQLIGDFKLRYEVDKLPNTPHIMLHIYRDPIKEQGEQTFDTRIVIL